MKWSLSFALLGVTILLLIFTRVDRETQVTAAPRDLIAVEIEQLVMTRYDSAGRELERSMAERAVRLDGDSASQLSDLTVRRRDLNDQEWTLESPAGVSEPSADTLTLIGGVVISAGDSATLRTDQVLIDIATRTATSTDKIRLTGAHSDTTSSGLIIDFDLGTATLLDRVTSTYNQDKQLP